MATVLERPPVKPQTVQVKAESPAATIIATQETEAAAFERWWQQLSLHDRVAAILLTIGEYGALVHGRAWYALLSPFAQHDGHIEGPKPRPSGMLH